MTAPARKAKRVSRLWYCRYHDERTIGRTHRVGGTDDFGCCYSSMCHRAREFREIPAPRRGKGAR